MAFLDFGFGTGLAYRHDYRGNDQFRAELYEAGERKKEREYQRKRDEKLDAEREYERKKQLADLEAELYPSNPISREDEYNTSRWSKSNEPKLKRLGEIANTPNWELDPQLLAEKDGILKQLENDESFLESSRKKAQFEKAKEDFLAGDISEDEFKQVEQEYGAYKVQKDGTKEFFYQSRANEFNELIDEYYGGLTGPLNESESNALAAEMVSNHMDVVKRTFDKLPEDVRGKLYGNDPMKFVKIRGKQIIPVPSSRGTGTKTTQPKPEEIINTKAATYFRAMTDGSEYGVNNNIKHFLPVDDGYLNAETVYFKDANGGLTELPYDDMITLGVPNINASKRWVRASDGTILIEARVKAIDNTEKKTGWFNQNTVSNLDIYEEQGLLIKEGTDGGKYFDLWVPADMSDIKRRANFVNGVEGTEWMYGDINPMDAANTEVADDSEIPQ